MTFDPDGLLAAMPRRAVGRLPVGIRIPVTRSRAEVPASSLGELGEYNGFTGLERTRTANLSLWLEGRGVTPRPATCEVCGKDAKHEHAEDYYDLATWVGLCVSCHVNALHRRFDQPARWAALLDKYLIPAGHWTRLVSPVPFDMAALARSRGRREPTSEDFVA